MPFWPFHKNRATSKAEEQDKTETDNPLNQVTYFLHLWMEGFSQQVQHSSGHCFMFIRQIMPNMFYPDSKGANDNKTR